MTITLGFDVYGTLIDTSGVATALEPLAGQLTPAFTALWRDKQLEYSFRRGLMQNYCHFAACTRHALDYCCQALGVDMTTTDKEALMARYRVLPAYGDVPEALARLQRHGLRLFAFSNGRAEDVAGLLTHAGIDGYFLDVVSTDEIKSFKPNPAVYAHFLRRAKALGHETWLISGNPFDVIGAISAGLCGAWVQRSEQAIFDPWELQPTLIVRNLGQLSQGLASRG